MTPRLSDGLVRQILRAYMHGFWHAYLYPNRKPTPDDLCTRPGGIFSAVRFVTFMRAYHDKDFDMPVLQLDQWMDEIIKEWK